uniref:RNase H type-1 domain-containing protein n=1 Tax=Manihot esculenta TaxID=3983 RepID=A0A2C9VP12_MANES
MTRDLHARSAKEFFFVVSKIAGPKLIITENWCAPNDNFQKLNVDGSWRSLDRKAFGGGVFRNSNGNWITGFTVAFGNSTTLGAEIRTIFERIKFVKRASNENIIIESDCKEVLETIGGRLPPPKDLHHLVQAIRSELLTEQVIVLQHAMRETNQVAKSFPQIDHLRTHMMEQEENQIYQVE